MGTGGAVTIPDGTYLVAPTSRGGQALTIASGMTLKLSSGAVLKAKLGGPESAALIAIPGPNVNVIGGTIAGDRASHSGTSDVGVGISIVGGGNVTLDGVTVEDFWSDGVAVRNATNVTLCGVLAQHNRRRGVGIESVEGFTATNSSFSNTYLANGNTITGNGGVPIRDPSGANETSNNSF